MVCRHRKARYPRSGTRSASIGRIAAYEDRGISGGNPHRLAIGIKRPSTCATGELLDNFPATHGVEIRFSISGSKQTVDNDRSFRPAPSKVDQMSSVAGQSGGGDVRQTLKRSAPNDVNAPNCRDDQPVFNQLVCLVITADGARFCRV